MDDRLIRLGVAECFAHEAGDGGGIIAQGINIGPHLPGILLLFLDFGIKPEDFAAHAFVLINEREINPADQYQNRNGHKENDRLRQPAPNAKINFFFHRPE